MEVIAKIRHLKIAPRKARLAASLIRGLSAAAALTELKHLPKRAALPFEKLVRSALANAKHNFNLEEKNLRLKRVLVDNGAVLKRFTPRAFGRAAPLRGRTAHITLILDEFQPSRAKSRQSPAEKKPEIRSATLAELRELASDEEKADIRREPAPPAPKKSFGRGFVSRVFNRKSV